MTPIFRKADTRPRAEKPTFFVTYRLLTGAGRTEANSAEKALALLDDLRRAGASNITIVDQAGRLVSFDPGNDEVG
jgi:hypothetical protein